MRLHPKMAIVSGGAWGVGGAIVLPFGQKRAAVHIRDRDLDGLMRPLTR